MARTGHALMLAAQAAALLSWSMAYAEPPRLPTCETSTKRHAESIVVTLDDGEDGQPRQGVVIEAGERLCLTGDLDVDGSVGALRLATRPDAWPLFAVSAPIEYGAGALRVRNLNARAATVSFAPLVGAIGLVAPQRTLDVGPFRRAQAYPRGRRFLLTSIRLGSEASSALAPRRASRDAEQDDAPFAMTLSFMGGVRGLRLSAIDRTLNDDGFSSLRTNWPAYGMLFELSGARLRFGFQIGGASASAGDRGGEHDVSVSIFEVSTVASYEVVRSPGVSLLVGTGPSFGGVSVTPWVPGYRAFAPRMVEPCDEDANVTKSWWGWGADLGSEYRLGLGRSGRTDYMLVVTFRAGYVLQAGSGAWETAGPEAGTRTRTIGEEPSIHVSGPRVFLGLGYGLY